MSQPIISVAEFSARLRKFPESAFSEIAPIQEFLQQLAVDAETLSPYLVWDHQHYTRNLIDKTPLYELVAICWEVGQVSSVHNHHEQNCWMAAPIGRLRVQNYRVLYEDIAAGKCRLEPTTEVEMAPGKPVAVDPAEPVHRVLNPREFNQRAVSLHVYSRPFDRCRVYSPEQQTCGEIQLSYTTEYGKPSRQVVA